MRHHDRNKKFGRVRKVRTAFMRSLARNLILNEKIVTTEARAKALRPFVERLITHAKEDTPQNRRLVAAEMGNDVEATARLFVTVGPRYKDRAGGYTRIVRMDLRPGDGAMRSYIGFV